MKKLEMSVQNWKDFASYCCFNGEDISALSWQFVNHVVPPSILVVSHFLGSLVREFVYGQKVRRGGEMIR